MEEDVMNGETADKENKGPDVVYNSEKDFYKGIGGEFRLKAEGLFKKAKEKGISIEEIDIKLLKENQAEFPGIGLVDMPAFLVKVKGKHLQSGQMMVDGKQIDYFNIYQKYVAEKIGRKNWQRDESGRVVRENNRPKIKPQAELFLTEWEEFEIGKNMVEDKEFGMEKTITGACDRVIRKLMGENDWLSPGEARMLDEEFNRVQEKIAADRESRKNDQMDDAAGAAAPRKATERQINYLKARIKNLGADPEDRAVMKEILRQNGFDTDAVSNLSTSDMSKIIDSVNLIMPKVKESLAKRNMPNGFTEDGAAGNSIRQ